MSDQIVAAMPMHVCPECGSELVQPADWGEAGNSYWYVELRCPECGWWEQGRYHQSDVDRFDDALDRETQQLIEDLRALQRANMEAELKRFSHALAVGGIMPEDF